MQAITIREKVLSADHPSLATSYHNLSKIYLDLGKSKEALDYARRAVAIMEKLFPNGHYKLDKMRKNLEEIEKQS